MRTTRHALGAAAAGLLILASCSGGEDDAEKAATDETGQQSATDKQAAAPSGPSLIVKADKTHAVQPHDEITLTISVEDFTLDASGGGSADQTGVGHYRVYLDEASGDDYLAMGDSPTAKVTIPGDVTDGSHDLRVVLHTNDGSPVEPSAQASVLLIVYRL